MMTLLIALLSVLQAGITHETTAPTYKVVGYYADWTAERYPLADIPADRLTHVNYAFGKIASDNTLTFNRAIALDRVYPGDCGEPQCPHGLFNQITLVKQRYPHLKFILSVGGWTDSGPFYEMAATEGNRQTFARSCAELLPQRAIHPHGIPCSVLHLRRHRSGARGH